MQSTHSDYTAKYVLAHSNASQTDDQDRKENVRIAAQNPEPHTNQNPVMSFYSPTICKSNGISIQDSISYASIKTEPIYTTTVSMNPAATEFFPSTSGFGNIGFGHEQHPTLPYFKDNMLPSSAVQNTALSSFAYSHPHAQVKQVLGDLHIPTNGVSSATQVSTTSFFCHNHPLASIQQTVHEPLQISNQVNKESSQNTNATSEQALLSLVKSLTDQVNLGRLPAPEPSIFTGDPLKYPGWKVDFTTLIEQRKIPSAERIHYLKKYLGGTAKEAVENFFLISSDNAYDEAKKLLDERFGDAYIVGNAFRDKLEKWPKIAPKDCKALQRFADFIKQCQTAMDSIGTLKCLNDDRENRKFLSKLPDWIVTRWSRIAYQWQEEKKEFPCFKVFADFLSKEAKIACNPVISLQSLKSDTSQAETRQRPTKPTG